MSSGLNKLTWGAWPGPGLQMASHLLQPVVVVKPSRMNEIGWEGQNEPGSRAECVSWKYTQSGSPLPVLYTSGWLFSGSLSDFIYPACWFQHCSILLISFSILILSVNILTILRCFHKDSFCLTSLVSQLPSKITIEEDKMSQSLKIDSVKQKMHYSFANILELAQKAWEEKSFHRKLSSEKSTGWL